MADLPLSRGMLIEYDSIVAQLATSAEDLTDLDGTFVETIFPEMLQARQHQIIFGRRGAGKTHLLRRVASVLRENFVEGGILPIYVNGRQLSQEISIVSPEPAAVALAIYVQLMQHIGEEIRRFIVALNQANFWDRAVGGKKSQAERQANEIATMLEETLTSGQLRLLPVGEASKEAMTLAETSKGSSVGASIKLDPRSLGWAVKAGTSAERSAKESFRLTHKIRGEVILPFAQVSVDLGRLLRLLGKASVHVLFDEWSEVDKDPHVQPYLAEMLRRTTSAVPGIYLKLACIPGRTFLATPITGDIKNPIGLEEGDDIHPDINLDSIVFADETIDQLAPFFMAMIKKHVGEKLEWVRHASAMSFESFLTTRIFSGTTPFLELCQASGGVPRDFINIYRAATTITANLAKSGVARQPFELMIVRAAAKSVYQSKRASFGKSTSPQLRLLDRIYQEIYVKKHSYLFLLSEESAEDDVVQTLYMEKLIHRMPATYYNPSDERRYQFFQLDYGTTIDRLMANAANDARASFESSLWTKIGLIGNKFLGRGFVPDITQETTIQMAAYTALFRQEAGRLDIDPRELIFHTKVGTSPRTSRSSGSRVHGKHRRG
jgi:hypothetical protein